MPTRAAFVSGAAAFAFAAWMPATGPSPSARPVVEPLHGKTLVSGKGFALPIEIAIVGEKIVAVNLPPAAPIQLRAAADGRMIKEIGTWGNGEDDFVGAYHIDPVQDKSSAFWAYDLTRHRMALIDVSDDALRAKSQIRRWQNIRSDAALTAPTWVGDSVLSPGFFYAGRLAVFGPDGKFARFAGSIPVKADEPPAVTQQAYQAVMRANPSRTMLAIGTRNASHLDFYSRDGQRVAAAKVPESFEPLYRVAYHGGEPKCLMDSLSRYGYLDVAAGKDYVVGLFSGRGHAEAGRIPDGRTIHVYNWKGDLLKTFELPALASAMAFDERAGKLYVVHPRPEPSLAVYDLPVVAAR